MLLAADPVCLREDGSSRGTGRALAAALTGLGIDQMRLAGRREDSSSDREDGGALCRERSQGWKRWRHEGQFGPVESLTPAGHQAKKSCDS